MVVLITGSSGLESFIQLITVLLIFLFVLAVTYFTTRWIGKYQQGQQQHKNIQVLETTRLTNNKCLQIVKAGDAYLLIAVCKDSVTMLTKLEESSIKEMQAEHPVPGESFSDVLKKIKSQKAGRSQHVQNSKR